MRFITLSIALAAIVLTTQATELNERQFQPCFGGITFPFCCAYGIFGGVITRTCVSPPSANSLANFRQSCAGISKPASCCSFNPFWSGVLAAATTLSCFIRQLSGSPSGYTAVLN
ncbi:hypothetical protein K438DRAFT_1969993 [Mycena galopus ATCC 62051]|nr:hypothetical protein K438DRAFT_1996143 [Mycena galopus ATCC 62051]KAF8192879.1 hypothetical protein K438DRAFT_1969993 [Mycena galopus ATCC 62051]